MNKKKKNSQPDTVNEPSPAYNRVTVSSMQQSYDEVLFYTMNMSHEERMAYLQKLREITHGTDMTEEEKKFRQSKIKVG